MALQDMDAMLSFGERWWWFLAHRSARSRFLEWRDNRYFLLEADGSAVEGILFVGEIV